MMQKALALPTVQKTSFLYTLSLYNYGIRTCNGCQVFYCQPKLRRTELDLTSIERYNSSFAKIVLFVKTKHLPQGLILAELSRIF